VYEELLQISCLYGAVKDRTLLNKLNVLWKHMVDLKMIAISLNNAVSQNTSNSFIFFLWLLIFFIVLGKQIITHIAHNVR